MAENTLAAAVARILDAACDCDLGYGVSCGRHADIGLVRRAFSVASEYVEAYYRWHGTATQRQDVSKESMKNLRAKRAAFLETFQ